MIINTDQIIETSRDEGGAGVTVHLSPQKNGKMNARSEFAKTKSLKHWHFSHHQPTLGSEMMLVNKMIMTSMHFILIHLRCCCYATLLTQWHVQKLCKLLKHWPWKWWNHCLETDSHFSTQFIMKNIYMFDVPSFVVLVDTQHQDCCAETDPSVSRVHPSSPAVSDHTPDHSHHSFLHNSDHVITPAPAFQHK